MNFDPVEKRLRCMGHVLNLIAEAYLFGQDAKSFAEDFKKAGKPERRKLWRDRGVLGKLHNLVAHVMASGKRTDLFQMLQTTVNEGIAADKIWKLVLDGGIRWNATYSMIRRAIELRQALDIYARDLKRSTDAEYLEIWKNDCLNNEEWETLELIRDHLEPLFRLTKDLEGNASLKEVAGKASHGALWEVLPTFEKGLKHFEELEKQAKRGEFGGDIRIQTSITLAWQKCDDYYNEPTILLSGKPLLFSTLG